LLKKFYSYFTTLAFLRNISSSQSSDAELVAQYKASGDQAPVAELYQRYMELIYGVCLKYLKQPEDAQDSVIAIYEELLPKLLKHEVDHFRAWVYTLAKNHCLMRLRSGKKSQTASFDVELMQSEEDLHLGDVLDREENFQLLDYCVAQLQAEQRQAIELFYLRGKCYKEIATETGLEWNRVRSLIQNGRRNLKICMEEGKEKQVTTNDSFFRK